MCLIWNLIKAFTDAEDDNKKNNNDLEESISFKFIT